MPAARAPADHRIGVRAGAVARAGELLAPSLPAAIVGNNGAFGSALSPRRRYRREGRPRDCDGRASRAACRPSRAGEPIAGGSGVNTSSTRMPSRGADAGEGIDHQADQRAVAQAGERRGVDRVEKLRASAAVEHRRLAALDDWLRPAHGGGRIEGQDAGRSRASQTGDGSRPGAASRSGQGAPCRAPRCRPRHAAGRRPRSTRRRAGAPGEKSRTSRA